MYPQVRARLIDQGVLKKHNIVWTDQGGLEGEEYEMLAIVAYGESIEIALKVYNLHYEHPTHLG
jgi:hypothetical protein